MARLQMKTLLRRGTNGSAPIRLLVEDHTGTAFSAGALMKLTTTTGLVSPFNSGTETTYANGAITTTTIAGNAVGIAMSASTATSGNRVPIGIAFNDVEIGLPVVHATAASALAAAALVGQSFELVQYTPTSGGGYVLGVGIDRTSSPTFVVTEVPAGSVGQQYGIVWGKIIAAERDEVLA